MKKVCSTKNMSREKWLEVRRAGLGGSEIGAVAGLSSYSSPIKVYLDKTEEPTPSEENEAMYFGNVLEPVVANEFKKRMIEAGHTVRMQNVHAVLQHDEHPWMFANIDRMVYVDGEKAILECKTAGAFQSSKWDDGNIPESYQAQVAWYMAVTGVRKAYIAVLIGGQKFKWVEMAWDQRTEEHLITIGASFWELVVNRTPPAMDGSDVADDWLQRKFASTTNTTVELDAGARFLLDQYERSGEIIKQHEGIKATARQNLEKMMGFNEAARVGEKVITWKTQETNRLNTAQLKKDHPALYENYKNTTTSRVFRVK